LGIGLTLVRSLAEQHGGSVSASSGGPGKGSEFVVRLPAIPRVAAPKTAPAATGAATEGARRILLVEDMADAAEMMTQLLEMEGNQVAVAHDGPEALAAVAQQRPDVVLMDIGLPGMDGYEVARRLRVAYGERTPPLIAVTGYGQEKDKERAREAGFICHLTKPVDLDALHKALATV
jgi:CheY-like chemotaxis protein